VPAHVAIAGTDADAADADADDHAVYMMDLFVDNLERSSHVKAVGAVADDGDDDKVLSTKNKKIMSGQQSCLSRLPFLSFSIYITVCC
jgi:hypothetical protein